MNPLEQTGVPVEDQFRSWAELTVQPDDKRTMDRPRHGAPRRTPPPR